MSTWAPEVAPPFYSRTFCSLLMVKNDRKKRNAHENSAPPSPPTPLTGSVGTSRDPNEQCNNCQVCLLSRLYPFYSTKLNTYLITKPKRDAKPVEVMQIIKPRLYFISFFIYIALGVTIKFCHQLSINRLL